MEWAEGVVVSLGESWPGAQVCEVSTGAGPMTALAYTAMVGCPQPGERVLLNVAAVRRGLGTGGMAFVVARIDGARPGPTSPSVGHIVKARYTPQQQMFLAVDEQESPHHDALRGADSLGGMPVLVTDLHSALPAIIAGARTRRPQARVAYVMTEGGALPLAFSRTVAGLREAGWIASTITVGQAFGGDHEAVSIHTGLLAAHRVVAADLAVVIQGPGNVGTDTRWGFSGVATVEALHAAHVLGGTPVAGLRVSGADRRERHRGISHHSRTAYGRALLAPATIPVTRVVDTELDALIRAQLDALVGSARAVLTVAEISPDGLQEALDGSPVPLSTMGRSLAEDPAGFVIAAATGAWAAEVSARP
jgi:hypothetical protein